MDHFLNEWDETVEDTEKICFGDRVITPNGDEGIVTELDSEHKYLVYVGSLGEWFIREELTKV